MEILSPAGSPQALYAAVASGADAVYFGGGGFNARHFAQNFEGEDMARAVSFCRQNGVRSYVTVNTLVSDLELPAVTAYLRELCALGVDAVIVQDTGLMRMLQSLAPKLPVIASTQAAANSLPAMECMRRLGCTRAVAGRELSGEELRALCQKAPLEVEAFCHGALCYSISGQCYLSAVLGRRSANRGKCAGPCRLPYSLEGGGAARHMLSLKDSCLAARLQDMRRMGIGCVKIEGRMKRPEYVSGVTRLYRTLLDEGRAPTRREVERVGTLFSRAGFTDGYYEGRTGRDMFGMRDERVPEKYESALAFERACVDRWAPSASPAARPVDFSLVVQEGRPASLTALCEGVSVTVEGPVPEAARTRPLTQEDALRALSKTGGTGFTATNISCDIGPSLMLPVSALNALRRSALEQLPAPSFEIPWTGELPALPEAVPVLGRELYCIFSSVGQVPDNAARADCCFVPLHEFETRQREIAALRDAGVTLGAVLPKGARDKEFARVPARLAAARQAGAKKALIYNLGHLTLCLEAGLAPVGDIGLNVYNSQAVAAMKELGLDAVTASCELSFPQIRDLHKCLPVGLLAYGRLPLMLSENCPAANELGCTGRCRLPRSLIDRRGEAMPLLRDGDSCRTVLCNAKTLYLADREEFGSLPVHFVSLLFTTEDSARCAQVLSAYLGEGEAKPADFTRGLYTRGVL